MITIIYSTHRDENYNNKFKQHLLQSVGLNNVQILEYVNHNQFTLSELYNKGIGESEYDIVVCCHNDIKLEKNWGKKLLQDFDNNPDYGIIGKAGSCYFPESGVYWERMSQTMVGQVYHHPPGQNKWINKYSPKLPFLIPVVTIDGLFISFDKTKIKHMFDESIGRFHFYDHLFCLPNYLDSVKIGVTSSFEITHESVGQPNQEFYESKEKFLTKWGSKLPLDLKPSTIYVPEVKEKPLKNIGKVAVIIPTKGKTNLLLQCLQSFIEHSNSQSYHIFVADTGSNESEILEIKTFIEENSSKVGITLIQYDYYNFAKINNDVVLNHITDEYEYLLFCNNDIKLLNNVIYNMLSIFKQNLNVGTVGARLHYEDCTIQHDGILILLNQDKRLQITHSGLRNYYNYTNTTKEVIGNTGALLMIRKNVFLKMGLFNENYSTCFEDVELNLKCVVSGFKNYFAGNSVAYHYESQTRSEDPEDMTKLNKDYLNNLQPYIVQNFGKINRLIMVLQ
jgi:GT2 family glycosyltransferase